MSNIPDFQTIMLPLLQYCMDKQEHSLRDATEHLAGFFDLSETERQALLPSGTQAIFDNRIGWSKTHLIKAGLLASPRRSYFHITERGLQVLAQNPAQVNVNLLKQFPEYVEFVKPAGSELQVRNETTEITQNSTPEESLEDAYQKIRKTLAIDLLNKIKQSTPAFFERMVVDLLVKMGYGGSRKDAGNATRLTNDGGIDGIINEDKLGLDVIYIQAKRWTDTTVGRPDIQSFVGALDGQRANKGIFITTSTFANTAIEYVKTISKKVILIDGEQLAGYMMDNGLGVSTFQTFELKRIDNDYFEE